MKGNYGYFATLTGIILTIAFLIIQSNYEVMTSDSFAPLLVILVFMSGFVGGFIAPYHVWNNSVKSMATIVAMIAIPIIALAMGGQDLLFGEGTGNPVADLGIFILFLVLIIGLIFVMLIGVIIIAVGGFVGSLFGKLKFDKDQFEDLDDYSGSGFGSSHQV